LAAIHPSSVYMEAPKRLNYPFYITRDTWPSRANLEVFRFSPSDGCPVIATLFSLDASLAILTRVLCIEAPRWLMTRLPRSPGSTLVLRLNQETVHDFILLFLQPCGPHLTPLATGSLERSLLVFSTPGGLTDNDLSRLFFTCTNTSQAATCTCNT
jgi:hypothetical protein